MATETPRKRLMTDSYKFDQYLNLSFLQLQTDQLAVQFGCSDQKSRFIEEVAEQNEEGRTYQGWQEQKSDCC
jgi:hypothetical protein